MANAAPSPNSINLGMQKVAQWVPNLLDAAPRHFCRIIVTLRRFYTLVVLSVSSYINVTMATQEHRLVNNERKPWKRCEFCLLPLSLKSYPDFDIQILWAISSQSPCILARI
jgi:hypothetical protein